MNLQVEVSMNFITEIYLTCGPINPINQTKGIEGIQPYSTHESYQCNW